MRYAAWFGRMCVAALLLVAGQVVHSVWAEDGRMAAVAADEASQDPRAAPEVQAPAARREVMAMLHLPPAHYRADGYGGSYLNDSGRIARRKLARDLARRHGLELVSDWPMPVLGIDCYVFALPPGADAERVAAALARDSRVQWAQPVADFRTLGGDPLYAAQPTAMHWHLADLHRVATGRKVTVAVIDSGTDEAHPDLAGQLAGRENFVEGQAYVGESHGTAVSGIIAALADNGIGIRGVAPGARVLALRACSERAGGGGGGVAHCDSFSLAKALNFAILRQPQIINMSLTGPPDRLLQRLLDAALGRGIRVVGAYDGQASDGGFPASWPGVIAVTDGAVPSLAAVSGVAAQRGSSAPAGTGAGAPAPAATPAALRALAAPAGRGRALSAPGRDIPAPLPGGRYGVVSGASYAAANVSGLLALVSELKPGAALAVRAGDTLDPCGTLAPLASACVCTCPLAVASTVAEAPRR